MARSALQSCVVRPVKNSFNLGLSGYSPGGMLGVLVYQEFIKWCIFSCEVSRGEKMLISGTDPESYITEYTLGYEYKKGV